MTKSELMKEMIESLATNQITEYNIESESVLQEILVNSNKDIVNSLMVLNDKSKKFSKSLIDISELEDASQRIYIFAKKLREDMELHAFFGSGKFIDSDKLKEIYKRKKLKKKFPNFNIDKFCEILENPILEIKNFKGDIIEYDLFVVKKFLIVIIQMIFNEMDFYMGNVGDEGSGKSCWSSQVLLWFYTILSITGMIEYEYNIKRLFFASILSMQNEQNDQKNDDYFRIYVLDEGNDLNRGNYREEENKNFKYSMRTSRRMLKITIINMQQLGELETSITLSRLNFIFDCKVENMVNTGTLNKGTVRMYIIPRGKFIYSPFHKRNISKIEIKNTLANKLDRKKDYYVSLPEDIIIYEFHFKNTWGFDKDSYDDYIKNETRNHMIGNTTKLSPLECFTLYQRLPPVKNWGTFPQTRKEYTEEDKFYYNTIKTVSKKIKGIFASKPELLSICRNQVRAKTDQKLDEETLEEQDKTELVEDTEIPNRFKEEVEYLPDLDPEKPKDFYFNANK
jgi:hypothetical protein